MSVVREILEEPKISVVIPAYNARKFIADAIDSVLAQTFPAHEIIIVDDGSKDGTAAFVQENYKDQVRVIQQDNKGQSAAINLGVKTATGNIIQFLDADDILLPNKFERQLDFWKRNSDFDIVYCDFLNFQHGKLPSILPPARARPQGNLLEFLVLGGTIHIHAPLLPKKIIEVAGFFREDIRVDEDQWFWVTCAIHGFTFGYLPEILVLRRWHDTNKTKDRISHLRASIEFHKWTLSLKLPHYLTKEVYRKLANNCAELAVEMARKRFLAESWKFLWQAWQYHVIASKIGSRRDKVMWFIDVLLWLNGVKEGVLGR